MHNFYIKDVSVTGESVRASSVHFNEGVNIINGASDTGKSYVVECLDYMFGSNEMRLDGSTGYDTVHITVSTAQGELRMSRPLGDGSKKIHVSSTDPRFDSDDYCVSASGNPSISGLWLRLIGIDENHTILKNERFEKQRLTWRTFLHMFLIKEGDIFQERSVIISKHTTSRTAGLSALLFLVTGRDYAETDEQVAKDIKKARRAAVIDYINEQLANVAKRKNELQSLPIEDEANIQFLIDSVLSDIETEEHKIDAAVEQSRTLMQEIIQKSAQLTECDVLLKRYQVLRGQYQSDVQRLTFTIEGELQADSSQAKGKCPFCDSALPPKKTKSYMDTSRAEIKRIEAQLHDLDGAERDLSAERESLLHSISTLERKRATIEALINDQLKPKVSVLKDRLVGYRKSVEQAHELQVLRQMEIDMQARVFDLQKSDDSSETIYKPKEYFEKVFFKDLSDSIVEMLTACHFKGLSSARFDIDTMDIVVNGQEKRTFGKGYRAFLNTTLAFSLLRYLYAHGKYSPGILVLDSPILSMKEPMTGEGTDIMKSSLFNYMIEHQECGQVIIVENDIPPVDYSKATREEFTGLEGNGRYGFLRDYKAVTDV